MAHPTIVLPLLPKSLFFSSLVHSLLLLHDTHMTYVLTCENTINYNRAAFNQQNIMIV